MALVAQARGQVLACLAYGGRPPGWPRRAPLRRKAPAHHRARTAPRWRSPSRPR